MSTGSAGSPFRSCPPKPSELVAIAETAPYGRGEETVVDRDVRRTWQVDSARVRIGGRHWEKTLGELVDQRGPRTRRQRAGCGRLLQASRLRRRQLLRRPSGHREGPRHVRDDGARAALGQCRRRTGGQACRPGGSARPASGGAVGDRLCRLLCRLRARSAAGHGGISPGPRLQFALRRRRPPAEGARLSRPSRRGWRRRCGTGRARRTSRTS